MNEQANTETNANEQAAPAETKNEPSKWGSRLKKAAKWTGIGIATDGLGAAGFFGMKYYTEHK